LLHVGVCERRVQYAVRDMGRGTGSNLERAVTNCALAYRAAVTVHHVPTRAAVTHCAHAYTGH
jgi:hypothetical protein